MTPVLQEGRSHSSVDGMDGGGRGNEDKSNSTGGNGYITNIQASHDEGLKQGSECGGGKWGRNLSQMLKVETVELTK